MSAASLPAVMSTAIAPLLRGPAREVAVLAVFPQAVYAATDDGEVIAVVSADGVRQPNAAVLTVPAARRPFTRLHPGQRGRIGDHRLRIAGLELKVSRWWDPRPRLGPIDQTVLADVAQLARARVAACAEPLPPDLALPLSAVAAALRADDRAAAFGAARRLIGRGPGLTPAGDDLLAGLISGSVLLAPSLDHGRSWRDLQRLAVTAGRLGVDVAAAARDRTTSLSATLLGHAARGELAVPASAFLHTLDGRDGIVPATDRLLEVGSTSGRDLALGLLAAAALVVAGQDHVTATSGRIR